MNYALSNDTYEQFQSERRNVIQEGTDQDNTRQVCQDSIKKIWPSGSFTFMVNRIPFIRILEVRATAFSTSKKH
jgi:uncharacterized protein (UPF0248 family)